MKCPCCETEMQKGYIRNSDQPVQWMPENKKPSIWKTGVAEDAVVLGNNNFWKGYSATAYHCPSCRFVIVPEE